MTNDTYREIEVKLYVPDLTAVRTTLEAKNATLETPRTHEYNVRYDKAKGNFAAQGMVLRLRRDDKIRITYKEPQDADALARGVHERYEAEIIVDNFDTAHTMLQKLGFAPYMTYEKYRTTYTLDGVEVVLDEMPYGQFVELEAPGEATIERVITTLGLTDAPRIKANYAQLFNLMRQHLSLEITDLTFENFAGIDIPDNLVEKL